MIPEFRRYRGILPPRCLDAWHVHVDAGVLLAIFRVAPVLRNETFKLVYQEIGKPRATIEVHPSMVRAQAAALQACVTKQLVPRPPGTVH